MEEFDNRVALVTGAGAGIGRAAAVQLARGGCNVGLFDRNVSAVDETARMVRDLGRDAVTFAGDVAVRADVDQCVALVADTLGAISILVNNAGILRTAPFLEISESDWRTSFAVNLDGVFAFSQAVLPAMIARGSGAIVNMSSWTGKKGVPNHAAYGATKAAIINLTQSLAGEFGEHGIRINAVCPGIIVDTEMRSEAEQMNRAQGLPDAETRARAVPLRRPGYPAEIAEVVAFLASDRAAYMTGQAINVTGGHWMNLRSNVMILISATPSPFARKVRISLMEKGVPFDLQNEVPWHADTETTRYNPLEQLPVLIPDEGDPVYESTYIMDWLEQKYPEPSMLPDDPDAALEAKLVQVIAEGVMDATVQLFWEMQREHISAEWSKRQLRKVAGGLAELDRRVGTREYVVGDRFGLADIAVISLLGMQDTVVESQMIPLWKAYDPAVDAWTLLYPNLVRYEAHHRERPSVSQTSPFMFDLAEKIV